MDPGERSGDLSPLHISPFHAFPYPVSEDDQSDGNPRVVKAMHPNPTGRVPRVIPN